MKKLVVVHHRGAYFSVAVFSFQLPLKNVKRVAWWEEGSV